MLKIFARHDLCSCYFETMQKKKRIYNKKYTLFMLTDASGMMLTAGFPSLLACLENDPF